MDALAEFARVTHNVPVVETVAGRAGAGRTTHPMNIGPVGRNRQSNSANAKWPPKADVVLAVGTRLQDFTTGSWTVFQNPQMPD